MHPAAHRFIAAALILAAGLAIPQRDADDSAPDIEELTRLVETHPESTDALLALAEAHAARGDNDRAAELYRRALEIDPELRVAGDRLIALGDA